MKKSLLLIVLFCAIKANAQTYNISFAGTGESVTVNTVKVENLTAGTSLTLNGSDILRLTMLATGINPVDDRQSSELKIYPNPMLDNSVLQIYPSEEGNAVITIFDITGKPVAQIQSYLENYLQEFRLSGISSGFYLISVNGNSYKYSGKLLSCGEKAGIIRIEKINNNQTVDEKVSKKDSKGIQTGVDMEYTAGDRLKFTGISGIYSTVMTDIPASDKTITFNFISCTDGDNNNYPVVEIGTQVWMEENLKTTRYRNGDLIGTTDQGTHFERAPKYQWPSAGDESNVAVYGRLYTWYSITDSRNACPTGWHVPSDAEWTVLTSYLGGESVAGGKLKETGTIHWNLPNLGATDLTGFTALPSGENVTGLAFASFKDTGLWWSGSEKLAGSAWYRYLRSDISFVGRALGDEKAGFSVRCVYVGGQVVLPSVTTAVSKIAITEATVGGIITNDGGADIIVRGVCWSTLVNPTIADSKTTDGTGTGEFTSSITGLKANTTYYVKAYATNSVGTAYGNEISFTTNPPAVPILTTTTATSITQRTATNGGSVTNDGGAIVTACGVYWGTSHNPETTGTKFQIGNGTGSFSTSLSGLNPNTTYFIKAYATNSVGTAYGNEISFTTNPLTVPILTTTTATSTTETTATSGGNITSDGGETVTARGVCWSTSANPTIADNFTSDGTGTGIFSSNLAGITTNTRYYIRAYATNSIGIAYGNEIFFSTSGETGPVSDRDGNTYSTIVIGTQTWMAENLKTTRYRNGDLIGTTIPATLDISAETTPKYQWAYDGNENNVATYGRLYTFYAVTDSRNVCPAGWHVPSDDEWTILTTYLGGDSVAGGKLKETGTVHWSSPNTGATNESGFTALAGGLRHNYGLFDGISGYNDGFWWSGSEGDANNAWYRSLSYATSVIYSNNFTKGFGFSVRCVRD